MSGNFKLAGCKAKPTKILARGGRVEVGGGWEGGGGST